MTLKEQIQQTRWPKVIATAATAIICLPVLVGSLAFIVNAAISRGYPDYEETRAIAKHEAVKTVKIHSDDPEAHGSDVRRELARMQENQKWIKESLKRIETNYTSKNHD